MAGEKRRLKEPQSLLRDVKSYLKSQWNAIIIGTLSVLGAWGLEPLISKDELCLLTLAICMTLSALFLLRYNLPRVSLVISLFALCFHSYAYYPFLRQAVIAILIAGFGISIWCLIQLLISKRQNDE